MDNLLLIQTQYALCHHLELGTPALKEHSVYQWLREAEVYFLLIYISKLWRWVVWG